MKTALLFSGKLGDWEDSSMSIMENIIWPLGQTFSLQLGTINHLTIFANITTPSKEIS